MAGPSSSRFHCTWHLLSLSSFSSLGLTNHWQPHLAVTTQQLGTATTSPGYYCLKATRPTLLLSQAHLISVPSPCMVLRQEPNSLDYTTSQVERVDPGHCRVTDMVFPGPELPVFSLPGGPSSSALLLVASSLTDTSNTHRRAESHQQMVFGLK